MSNEKDDVHIISGCCPCEKPSNKCCLCRAYVCDRHICKMGHYCKICEAYMLETKKYNSFICMVCDKFYSFDDTRKPQRQTFTFGTKTQDLLYVSICIECIYSFHDAKKYRFMSWSDPAWLVCQSPLEIYKPKCNEYNLRNYAAMMNARKNVIRRAINGHLPNCLADIVFEYWQNYKLNIHLVKIE